MRQVTAPHDPRPPPAGHMHQPPSPCVVSLSFDSQVTAALKADIRDMSCAAVLAGGVSVALHTT